MSINKCSISCYTVDTGVGQSIKKFFSFSLFGSKDKDKEDKEVITKFQTWYFVPFETILLSLFIYCYAIFRDNLYKERSLLVDLI